MFNIWFYILALLLGIVIGFIIHILLKDSQEGSYKRMEKDGIIYIVPKATRTDIKQAEQQWREGMLDRKI